MVNVGRGALSNLTNKCQKGTCSFRYRSCGKRRQTFIKDSIDGLLIVELDDDENTQEVWGVEIKSRVATNEINTKKQDYQRKVYAKLILFQISFFGTQVLVRKGTIQAQKL